MVNKIPEAKTKIKREIARRRVWIEGLRKGYRSFNQGTLKNENVQEL